MIYAVNVFNFKKPDHICMGAGLTDYRHAFQGFHSGDSCFRQVSVFADSIEEALVKAESIKVYT